MVAEVSPFSIPKINLGIIPSVLSPHRECGAKRVKVVAAVGEHGGGSKGGGGKGGIGRGGGQAENSSQKRQIRDRPRRVSCTGGCGAQYGMIRHEYDTATVALW